MSDDQTIETKEQPVSLSPEIKDLVGFEPTAFQPKEDQTGAKAKEEVKPSEEVTPPSEAPGEKPKDSEVKEPDKPTDEPKKPESEGEKPKDEKAKLEEFEVAGKKYSSFEEAVKVVNSISGDNTRLAGELKQFKNQNSSLQEKLDEASVVNQALADQIKAWEAYNRGELDEIPNSFVDQFQKIEQQKKEKQTERENTEFSTLAKQQIDDIYQEPDFETYRETFIEMIKLMPDNVKIEPETIYQWSKDRVNGKKKDNTDIEKIVEQRVKQELAKIASAKTAGGESITTPQTPKVNLSPEIADLVGKK